MMASTKINGSARLNKRAARALDKKCLLMTSPEPLIQIQNNLTELFLNTFTAKRDCSRIYRSLPNATTVEI